MNLQQRTLWDYAAPVEEPRYKLRPYQEDALTRIDDELRVKRSTLAVLATGMGKTVLFGAFARRPGRGLIIAHRDELITQAQRKVYGILREPVGREQADWKMGGERVIVGSVQTLANSRLTAKPRDAFDWIVVDECHHATARTYRAIFDHFAKAKILGVTATADRGDGVALGQVFESTAYRMEIAEGTREGWLVPISVEPLDVEVDLSGLRTTKDEHGEADFAAGQLDERILTLVEPIAEAALEHARDMRTIVFTPGRKSAHAAAARLNARRPGCAVAVDGETEPAIRARIKERHQAGEFQFLVNCNVYTEGYDDPGVACMLGAKPTKSRAAFTQMVGRITRPVANVDAAADQVGRRAAIAASEKPRAVLLDLTANSDRHQLVGPVDLLGGRYSDEVRKRAKKKLEAKGGDVQQALEEAAQEIADAAAKVRARVTRRQKRVDGRTLEAGRDVQPISEGQRRCLLRLKTPLPKPLGELTRGEASRLIGREMGREKYGLIRLAAVEWWKRLGIDATGWKHAQAERAYAEYLANGRQRPQLGLLDAAVERVPGEDG